MAPLVCPACRGPLDAASTCRGCGERWGAEAGFPRLYRPAALGRAERLLRRLYDHVPGLHDPLVHLTFPVVAGTDDPTTRRRIAMALGAPGDRPVEELLDVGIGGGGNLAALRAAHPTLRGVWGIDTSRGMLRRCPSDAGFPVHRALADAHALPFPDESFDAVVQVGALNAMRDPVLALREMLRVARPGARVLVVDEGLDPAVRHGPARRVAFRALTFYDRAPGPPPVPEGAEDRRLVWVNAAFYALSFRRSGRSP